MKYLLGFIRFWRHFIVGDDGLIAIAVMWTLLLTWAFAKNYSNIWVIVPFCVVVLMVVVLYRRVAKGVASDIAPTQRSLLLLAVLPFVALLTVPLAVFRITFNQVGLDTILLPFALFCLTALVLWWVAAKPFGRFPVMTVFLFGAASYLITLLWQQYYIRVAAELYREVNPLVLVFAVVVVIVAFINACIRTLRRDAK